MYRSRTSRIWILLVVSVVVGLLMACISPTPVAQPAKPTARGINRDMQTLASQVRARRGLPLRPRGDDPLTKFVKPGRCLDCSVNAVGSMIMILSNAGP